MEHNAQETVSARQPLQRRWVRGAGSPRLSEFGMKKANYYYYYGSVTGRPPCKSVVGNVSRPTQENIEFVCLSFGNHEIHSDKGVGKYIGCQSHQSMLIMMGLFRCVEFLPIPVWITFRKSMEREPKAQPLPMKGT
jgi:hypothetical protein